MPPPRLPPIGRNLANQRTANKGAAVAANRSKVPNEIKCFVCQKVKHRSQYAKRQISRFEDTIHNPYAPAGRTLTDPRTTCMTCTPQQTTELTCCVCTKTKGLTLFAKNQRKNPDVARCLKCVQMHLDTEPDYEPPDSEGYTDSDSEDDYDFDDPGANRPKGTQEPKIRRGAGGGAAIDDENIPLYAQSTADSAYEDEAGAQYPHADDGWENVTSAGSRATLRKQNLPSYGGPTTVGSTFDQSSSQRSTSKSGWAKVAKVPKGQEVMWGQAVESDQWDQYARQLTNRRDATKKPTKKKQVNMDSGDDDDDDDDQWN